MTRRWPAITGTVLLPLLFYARATFSSALVGTPRTERCSYSVWSSPGSGWATGAGSWRATRAGAAALRRLCEDNPRRVLAGEDLT